LGAWSALGTYNSLVSLDEGVKTAWAQVENQYQRRLDLIPNLVNTVKGFAAQEKDVLESVVQARASASKPVVNINDAQQIAQFQEAQA
jgi:LemA protein